MEIQYIYDEKGRETGVIVPIELWNKISNMKRLARKEKDEWDPSKYRGMYKNLKVDVIKESKSLREE